MIKRLIAGLLLCCLSACGASTPVAQPAATLQPSATIRPTSTSTLAPTSSPTSSATTTTQSSVDPTDTPTTPPTTQPPNSPTSQPTNKPTNIPSIGDATPNPPPETGSCGQYPCNDDISGWVARIQVPPGFTVSHVGKVPGEERITSITFGPDGRLYASVMSGNIYVFDAAGSPSIYSGGFHLPIGLAFRPSTTDLYVASRSFPADAVPNEGKVTIVRADGSQQNVVAGLPCCYTTVEHQPNSLAFGPDGKVYLSIGARSDHGEDPNNREVISEVGLLEAGILRFNPDGTELERFAAGLRNPYDLAFDANGRLFATDNGADHGSPERLHHIVQGGHYGYPFYAGCDKCPAAPPDLVITPPIASFIPHGAITGITTYTSSAFPSNYYNDLFVVLWSAFPGAQKVVRVSTFPTAVSDFALGFASPIDVTQSPDGALLVADWATGHIFRIAYNP